MKLSKIFSKLWKFAIKNYFIGLFFACIAFVLLVSGYKLFFSKPTYVYVRVEVGQGMWWASTQKPNFWFVKNIKKSDMQSDLLGQPVAQILSVRYYPTYLSNQYDVFLTLKLKVSSNKKNGPYSFNRASIGVGAPIDLEFPSEQFSGTVTDLSTSPISDRYVQKTIYLSKSNADPWEYDAIKTGDKYFDGENNILEIKDKSFFDVISNTDNRQLKNITVKATIWAKDVNNKLIYGEVQIIAPGKNVYLSTDNFSFNNYIVSKVE